MAASAESQRAGNDAVRLMASHKVRKTHFRLGLRQPFDAVPKKLQDMADDPYRSLAASVEERGGFSKPDEPFFEFLWANHFRNHVAASLVKRKYGDATEQALRLARSSKSAFLPGWAGKK